MLVCLEKASGRLIEMQSHASPGTLVKNAVNSGWDADAVDEREVTEEEYEALRRAEPPLPAQVDQERDRRVADGFMFKGKLFQSREDDQTNIAGAVSWAILAVGAGAQPGDLRWNGGTTDFAWIADDNTLMPMDAFTVIDFGKTAAAWKSGHVFAARALKDALPIPADYTSDAYWPVRQ